MSIKFPNNIKLNSPQPLDTRFTVANATERLALSYIYEGLIVFENDTKISYVAYLDDSSNWKWKALADGEQATYDETEECLIFSAESSH